MCILGQTQWKLVEVVRGGDEPARVLHLCVCMCVCVCTSVLCYGACACFCGSAMLCVLYIVLMSRSIC